MRSMRGLPEDAACDAFAIRPGRARARLRAGGQRAGLLWWAPASGSFDWYFLPQVAQKPRCGKDRGRAKSARSGRGVWRGCRIAMNARERRRMSEVPPGCSKQGCSCVGGGGAGAPLRAQPQRTTKERKKENRLTKRGMGGGQGPHLREQDLVRTIRDTGGKEIKKTDNRRDGRRTRSPPARAGKERKKENGQPKGGMGRKKEKRQQTTPGRDGRTARRHHTGILRRGCASRRPP